MRRKLIMTALFAFASLVFLTTKGSLLDPVLKYVGNPVEIRVILTQVLLYGGIIALALTIIRTLIGIMITLIILLLVYLFIHYGHIPFFGTS